jgi:hypothetical protein
LDLGEDCPFSNIVRTSSSPEVGGAWWWGDVFRFWFEYMVEVCYLLFGCLFVPLANKYMHQLTTTELHEAEPLTQDTTLHTSFKIPVTGHTLLIDSIVRRLSDILLPLDLRPIHTHIHLHCPHDCIRGIQAV